MAKEFLQELSAFIEEATSDCCEGINLECKHFFSGAALYANSRICVSLTPVGLGVKLPEEIASDLLISKRAVQLRYFPKAPVKKGYVLFPGGISRALQEYVRASIEYVLTLPRTE